MAAKVQPDLPGSVDDETSREREMVAIDEAAAVLNVDRGYLVQLLDSRTLPSRGEGERRQIRRDDLHDYKQARDILRRMYLHDLTRLSIEYGLDDVDYTFVLEDADSSDVAR